MEFIMPTASITLPSGAKVVIDGTSSEVADLIAKVQGSGESAPARAKPQGNRSASARTGPLDLLGDLIEGGFFKTPQELGSVRSALEAQGHFYPTTTLSPLMLRLVRRKQLRRIKTNKRWTYVR
jgi:hypothetical protein